MKLGFEESQSPYDSGSQSARFWTEKWVERSLYCPNCGSLKLDKFPNNRPVADFLCSACNEEFELKSQKTKFGAKALDGAYRTMRERIVASNNPNFLFMNYSLKAMGVVDLFVVPKHFFVPEILEKRKPLADTARRAGWIGCNILLSQIPESGKIFFVHMSPHDSDDLTEIIELRNGAFVVLWSPETAEHDPDYRELWTFPTREQAEAYLQLG